MGIEGPAVLRYGVVHFVVVTTGSGSGCCAGVYKWRDRVARAEDESLAFVLSKVQLLELAQVQPTADQLCPERHSDTSHFVFQSPNMF